MMSIVNQSVNMKKIALNENRNEQQIGMHNTESKKGNLLAETIRINLHIHVSYGIWQRICMLFWEAAA